MSTEPMTPVQVPQTPPPAFVVEDRRRQADPLPSKRGEIGYVEGLHFQANAEEATQAASLPARHPADRDSPPPADGNTPSIQNTPTASEQNASSSANYVTKSPSILKKVTFGGVQLITLLIFSIQVLVFAGTITAWVVVTKVVQRLLSSNGSGASSSTVFVHVVFVIAVIFQVVFLERRIFRLRGERYSYLHPGEVLPRHRTIPISSETGIAFAPWNRPPLPTYAAALAQSGVGTGDVEDHLIAAQPPPAYGNTRGSTLLLQGFLRESLRAQRPPSVHSTTSQIIPGERPVSYASRNGENEEIPESDRALRLEETLSRLESPQSSRR